MEGNATEDVLHQGGCHCARVRFKVFAPKELKVIDCNCSICRKKQNLHFIVPSSKFELVSGNDVLKEYKFNTMAAKHLFCSICGVQSFFVPRSNADGYGVMPHCLDDGTVEGTVVEKFDGINWDAKITQSDIQNRSKIP